MTEEFSDPRIIDQRPMTFSEEWLRRHVPEFTEMEREAWGHVDQRMDGLTGLNRQGQFNPGYIPQGDDYMFGHLSAAEATHRMMAGNYQRGLLGRNTANEDKVAQKMLRGRDKLTGMGRLTEEREAFLRGYVGRTSNWLKNPKKHFEPGAGIGLNFYDSPFDLLEFKMPGFSTEKMLDELSEEDSGHYAFLVMRYGSREALEEMIGETNNPDHFFFNLNTDLENKALQKSIAYHMDEMEGIEELWSLTVWPFLRDGLLNDPDMPASLALGVATAGVGFVGGAASVGLKLASNAKRLQSFSRTRRSADVVANWGARHSTKVSKITHYLPENIATTLAKKYWKSYPQAKLAKHLVVNPVLNFSEGMLTGGAAEFLNQTMKINYDQIESYSASAIWREALFEGAFSIVANPILGGAMRYMSKIAIGAPAAISGKTLINRLPEGRLRDSVLEAINAEVPEGTNRLMLAFDRFDNATGLADTINSLLGEGTVDANNLADSKIFTAVIEPLLALVGRDVTHTDVMAFAKLLTDISINNNRQVISPEALLNEISAGILANNPDATDIVGAATDAGKYKVAAIRYMEANGIEGELSDLDMTPETVVEILKFNPSYDRIFAQLDPDITAEEALRVIEENEKITLKQLDTKISEGILSLQQIYSDIERITGKPVVEAPATTKKPARKVFTSEQKATRGSKAFKDSKTKLTRILESDSDTPGEAGIEIWKANKRLTDFTLTLTVLQKAELQDLVSQVQDKYPDIDIHDPTYLQFLVGNKESLAPSSYTMDVVLQEEDISAEEAIERGLVAPETINRQRERGEDEIVIVSKVNKPIVTRGDNLVNTAEVILQPISIEEGTVTTPEEQTTAAEAEEQTQETRDSIEAGYDKAAKAVQTAKADENLSKEQKDQLTEVSERIDADKKEYKSVEQQKSEALEKAEEDLKAAEQEAKELLNELKEHTKKNKGEEKAELLKKLLNGQARNIKATEGIKVKTLDISEDTELKEDIDKAHKVGLINSKLYKKLNKDTVATRDLAEAVSLVKDSIVEMRDAFSKKDQIEVVERKVDKARIKVAREEHADALKLREQLGLADFSIASTQEMLRARKDQARQLDSRLNAFKARMETEGLSGEDTIKQGRVAKYMPNAEIRSRLSREADNDLTIDTAVAMLEAEITAQKEKAAKLNIDWVVGVALSDYKNNPDVLTGININTVKDAPVTDRSNLEAAQETEARQTRSIDEEAANKLKELEQKRASLQARLDTAPDNRGGRKTKLQNQIDKINEEIDSITPKLMEEIQSREEVLDALVDFHGHLSGIARGPWGREEAVPIFVIDSALRNAGGGSLFDVNMITLVRDAVRNLDGTEIDSRVSGTELLYQYDSLGMDVEVLMQAVARLISKHDIDQASIVDSNLSAILKKLRDPNQRNSKHGLLTALGLVRRLGKATQDVNIQIHKDHGFALDFDEVSGNPKLSTATRNVDTFIAKVKKAMATRLEGRIVNRNGRRVGKLWKHVQDKYEIKPNEEFDVIVDKILAALETEDRGITQEDIINMGNGELSYQPANKLGYQIIDYMFTKDGLISLQSKAKRDFRDSQVTEATEDLSNYTGESTRVLPYLFGELNSVAPEKLSDIAMILEDDLLRRRISFVTKLKLVDKKGNLTEEFEKINKEWEDMKAKGGVLSNTPRGINVKLNPGVRLRPYIQNATTEGKFLSHEETEDVLVEMLMNHAQTGYYFIHDNRYTSGKYSLMYRDTVYGGTVDENITLGDPTIPPMSNIGSLLALEQMSPYLARLTEIVLDRMETLERKWHEEGVKAGKYKEGNYWENSDFWADILDPRNQRDRSFNGKYVTKILGMSSEEGKAALENLVDGILKAHVPDMYIRTGLYMWNAVKAKGDTSLLGPLEPIFHDLQMNGITDSTSFDSLLNSTDTERADLRKQAKLLRDILKHPVMTKLYSAGMPTFIAFWKEGGMGFERGKDRTPSLWDRMLEAGLVTKEDLKHRTKNIPTVLYTLGNELHNAQYEGVSGVLLAALGTKKYSDKAKDVLRIDERREEGAYDTWAHRVEAMTGKQLDNNNKMKRMDTMRRQLEYNILRLADNRKKDPEELRKDLKEQLDQVDKIFERAEAEERDITKEEHDEIQAIFTPNGAWKDNLLYYALNLMNSSGFKASMAAMELQAGLFGYKFDADWFMGLENYILYQVFLPGQNSQRTYATEAALERHHHTVAWGKMMSDPQKAEEFHKSLTEEDVKDPNKLMGKIWDWMKEQEGESPLGIWQATDNIEFIGDPLSLTTEELAAREQKLRNKVKALMLQENLLALAMFDALPIDSYRAEENQLAIEKQQMEDWAAVSNTRGEEHKARRRNMIGLRDPELRHEAGRVGVNPRAGGGTQVQVRGRQEVALNQAIGPDGKTIFRDTNNPKGLFAWQPLMERTPYLSLGNLELQSRLYEAEREKIFGPLELLQQDMFTAKDEGSTTIIPNEHRNHSKPWNAESLFSTVPARAELIESLAGLHVHPVRREAAMMELNFRNWLTEQGLEYYLDPNHPEFEVQRIPYLYLAMKADQWVESDLHNITRAVTMVEEGTARETSTHRGRLQHASNMWHLGLNEMSELSRNILYKVRDGLSLETKGHEIGITDPNLRNKTLTEILTSVYDPSTGKGHLMSPTLMHKALGFGMVLGEGIVISEGKNPGEGIRTKEGETDVWPLIVQNNDFNSYLVAILWDSFLWKAIRKYNSLYKGKYSHIKEVGDWNSIDPADRKEIIQLARNTASELDNPLVEFTMIAEDTDNEEFTRLVTDSVADRHSSGPKKFRNAFGGNFSALVRTNRIIKGATIKMGLTPEGALLMLASNTNYPLLRRLETAYHNNKMLGVVEREGELVPIEPESQIIANEYGYNMRAMVESRTRESDALKPMMESILGRPLEDGDLNTLVDETRRIGRDHPEVVDWTSYRHATGRSFEIEALLSPLRAIKNKLDVTGIGDFGSEVAERLGSEDINVSPVIAKMLEDVDYFDNDSVYTQEAVILSLLLRDDSLSADDVKPFFTPVDEDITESELLEKEKRIATSWQRARRVYRKLQRVAQMPDAEVFNQYYWDARLFLEQVLDNEFDLKEDSDLVLEFLATLKPLQKKRDERMVRLQRKLQDLSDERFALEEKPRRSLTQSKRLQEIEAEIPQLQSDIEVLAQSRIDPTEKDVIDAQLALAAALKEQNNEAPAILTEIPRKAATVRSHSTFSREYPELAHLSDKIEQTYGDSLKSRMMRSVLARVFQIQPSIVANLEFTFDTMENFLDNHGKRILGFAEKSDVDAYEIGTVTNEDIPAAKLAYVFAHEFAHIGMTKFMKEGGQEYRQWRRLFLGRTGKSLMRKTILAARDGVWSSAAQREYDGYMNAVDENGNPDPTEFIAAITGYYIVNDSLPLMEGLTQEEADLVATTEDTVIKRILHYIHQMMSKLATVFNDFKTEAPEEWTAIQNLIHRTMGYGVNEKLINNPPTGPMYMTTEPKEQPNEVQLLKLSQDLDRAQRKERELRIDIETQVTQAERLGAEETAGTIKNMRSKQSEVIEQVANIEAELESLGANDLDPWGLTNAEFVVYSSELKANFTDELSGAIDINKVLVGAHREGGRRNNVDYVRTLASLITRRMRDIYAGKNGEFGVLADSALDNLPFFAEKKGRMRKMLAGGLISSTGANFTWNSPFQLLVWLSTFVDNTLTTVPGHWGNIKGLPDVTGAIGQVDLISVEIGNLASEIDRKIVGVVETHLKLSDLKPSEKNIEVKNRIGRQILQKIEGNLDVYTDDILVQDTEIAKLADDIVTNYKLAFEVLQDIGDKVGSYAMRDVTNMVPYRFATGLLSHKRTTAEDVDGFVTSFGNTVEQNIKTNARSRIDPFTAYVSGILPTIGEGRERAGLKELVGMKAKYPGLYNRIVVFAEVERTKRDRTKDTEKEIIGEKEKDIDRTVAEAEGKFSEDYYREYGIPAVAKIMAEMGSLNKKTGTPVAYGLSNNNEYLTTYMSVLETTSEESLKGEPLRRLREVVNPNNALSKNLVPVNQNPYLQIDLKRVTDIHTRNIADGAGVNAYFPKLWSIPPVSTVMSDTSIANMLVWHPETLMDGIMRSTGQDTVIQSMLLDEFNLTGHREGTTPAHLMLDVFKTAMRDTSRSPLANEDGTVISMQDRRNFMTGLNTMQEKLDVVLGRAASSDIPNEGMNIMTKYAPDVVRIVYGTNLTMATLIVENTMNVLDNFFGRRSLSGTAEAMLGIFKRFSPEVRRTVARDQADILRAFSQGFIPDFASPGSDIRTNIATKGFKWLGERNMHLAGHIHEMIATSRAIIFRNWIKDNLNDGKLQKIAPIIKEMKPDDLKGMKAVMKRAKLPVPDSALMSYLVSEGLFSDPNKLASLKEMINTGETGVYHLGDMIMKTSAQPRDARKQTLDTIHALKRAERSFINEVLVNPNPFDNFTGNGSWDTMIEIFRRYPVLFASQQMYRKSQRFSPSRMAFNLTAYALMDMMYMAALMASVGYDIEDILEQYREDPVKTMANNLARLPHLGRYLGLTAEIITAMAGWGYGTGAMEAVALSALTSYGKNAIGIGKEGFDPDTDIQPHRIINAARVFLPAEMRILLYQILGEDYMRQRRGSGGRGPARAYGTHQANLTPPFLFRELLVEQGIIERYPNAQDLWHKLPYEMQQSFLERAQRQPTEAVEQPQVLPPTPEAPSPQTASPGFSGQDPVSAIESGPTALKAPEQLG